MVKMSLVFIEYNEMEMARYPPYFQDSVLSDFFLFSHIQGILSDRSFYSANDLLLKIQVILASIENAILLNIFVE
jgi:hypothetical protein